MALRLGTLANDLQLLHTLTQALLAGAQRFAGVLAIGDIAVRRHEATVRHGIAAHLEDDAVRARPFEAVCLEPSRQGDAILNQLLDIAGTVLTALGIVPDEVIVGRAGPQ